MAALVWLALLVVGGCSSDDPGPDVRCGSGTTLQGGQCVAVPSSETTTCGEGTTLEGGKCVPSSVTECGEGTALVEGTCIPAGLEPGHFMPPLVHLQRAYNPVSNHMHLDEVRYRESDSKLFVCSYTFEVLDASNPGSMKYISGANGLKVTIPPGGISNPSYPTGTRTGGCINVAWDDTDNDVVYTTHKGNIDDPAYLVSWRLTPSGSSLVSTQLPMLQEPGVSYEGIDVVGGKIFVAMHEEGLGVFERNPVDDTLSRVGHLTGLDNAITVRVSGTTAFVANGLDGIATIDVSDPTNPLLLGTVSIGGQARDLRVAGNFVYVAAGSAGLVVVDATDLAAPKVVGGADMPGSAIRLDYSTDKVYVAGWNDARVYDVSTPETPQFLGAARVTEQLSGTTVLGQDDRPEVTNRILGIAGSGDSVFVGAWHVPHSFRLHADRKAPYMYLPESLNLTDFGPVEVGKSGSLTFDVHNEGNAPLTLFNAWTVNSAYAITPSEVRIDPGTSAEMTVTFTPTMDEMDSSIVNLASDDPSSPLRKGWLVGNQAGLGIGSQLPLTTVSTIDGGTWSSAEHVGEVTLLAYFATF